MKNRLRELSDLDASLLVLAALVMAAIIGVALDDNWPKVARVMCAAVGYGATLRYLLPRSRAPGLLIFVLAGGVGGLISGLMRPEALPLYAVLAQTAGAAFLLAPAHWLALRYHRHVKSMTIP